MLFCARRLDLPNYLITYGERFDPLRIYLWYVYDPSRLPIRQGTLPYTPAHFPAGYDVEKD